MDFLERLSAVVCGKQYLFKQDDGMYYSKYHCEELEVEEAEEWLLDRVKTESEISENNYNVGKIREDISYRRLSKISDYLKSTGLTDREIIDIIKLEEEMR